MTSSFEKPRPDFAVIGAMRGGTTQIYELLRSVPGICVPHMKETDFFCSEKSFSKGFDWYAHQFTDENSLWGDISPNYAKTDINPDAARLLYEANPDMHIFFIARDPVDRAISHYNMVFYIEEDLPTPEVLLSKWAGKHILHASCYYTCLLPFWNFFGDRVTILEFKTLITKPESVIQTICKKLGIQHTEFSTSITPQNSFEELARTPDWWGKLRRTDIGTTLRANMPRPLLNFAKTQLSLRKPKPAPPEFSSDIRAQISERLAPDASLFRRETGMVFEDWKI